MARVAVLGGGIAGLSAAWELESHGVDVVVLEAAPEVGGKLAASPVPPLPFPLDEGADAFLARVPDAIDLCTEIGIHDLVNPEARNAHVYARGGLHPLPAGQVLGVPTDLDELARSGLVSAHGLARAESDLQAAWPAPTGDQSVGALIRERLGDEICEHLVEPLLGGINAGEADGLSARAAAPQIWACAEEGGSLIEAAARVRATANSLAPVFAAPAEGMAAVPRRLAELLRGEIRPGTPVEELRIDSSGDTTVMVNGERFDGAVVAVPAHGAADLLRSAAPDAADELRRIDFASVAMVTVVADAVTVDHPLDGSGFVVARNAGLSITAASWGSSKWAHWNDGDHVVLRVSLGHDADPTDWCGLDDPTLVDTVLGNLRTAMDVEIVPVGTRVGRWPRSFPQYRPGHLDLADRIHAAVSDAGPVSIAGASLDGIGVPACIRHGRAAARSLLA